jgi:hypothetical protein
LFNFTNNDTNYKHVRHEAFYIPPKQEQAFLQGGTFVFKGTETVFAHYDPSTAAYPPLEKVVDIAKAQLPLKAT